MLGFAVGTWLCHMALLTLVISHGLRHARIGITVFAAIVLIVSALRQPLYFFGLDFPNPQTHFNTTEWELIVVANFHLLMWVLVTFGTYLYSDRVARFLTPIYPAQLSTHAREPWSFGVFMVVIVPCAISVLGTAFLIAQFGGVAGLTFAAKVSKELQGLFVIRAAGALASFLAFYGMLTTMQRKPNGGFKLSAMSWFYLLLVILAMIANFTWGNRYSIALVTLGLVATFHFYVRPFKLWEFIATGLAFALMMQSLKLLRLALISDVVGFDVTAETSFWLDISLSLHLAEFDAFLLAIRDAGTLFDYRMGQDFINGLLSWLPRSIWADKETFHIGGWFRRLYEPEKINGWPVTTPGSWYVNFGTLGIVVGGMVSGILVRAYDQAFSELRTNPWHAAVGPGLAFFLIEGGVNTGFPQFYVLYLVPLYIALVWIVFTTALRYGRRTSARNLAGAW